MTAIERGAQEQTRGAAAARRKTAPSVRHGRLLRQQESLRLVIESISAELELRPLLTRIVDHACELIGATDGSIGLVDEARNVVRTEAVHHMPPEEIGAEMPVGVGLAGTVLRTGEPLVLRRYGDLPQPTRHELAENAVIGMPVTWRGRMIGFFGLGAAPTFRADGGIRRRRFSRGDVQALATYARHAAIAIANARIYSAERQRTERLALISRVGRLIAADLRLDELLQRAADAIHDLLGYPNVAIPLIDPDDPGTLVLTTVGGSYRGIVRGEYRIPVASGIMGAAARGREAVLVNDVARDPRHLPTPGAEGITAELAVPILLGHRVLGVLNVESTAPFTDEDAAGLQIIADQLAVAIENARLYASAQQVAVLEERQRLARELHDSVTQQLFSIGLIAQSLAPAFARDAAEGARRAERVTELSQAALAEMRALLAELRPADPPAGVHASAGTASVGRVRRLGLVAALRALAADVARDGLAVEVCADDYRPQLSSAEEALYRIAQEALTNATKHARARQATVRLANGESVRLDVRDDGTGFDPATVAAQGFGLLGMRERAEALGGTLRVESAPGAGTRVEVRLPLPREGVV